MSVDLTLAVKEFNRAAEECIKHTERTYPQFLNGQALRLASFAVRETEKADANKIAVKLGQTGLRTTNARTGAQLKKARRVFGNSKASLDMYRIINWRRKRAGKKAIGGRDMSGVARKFRAASLRSTAFIASGWVSAIRALARVAGYSSTPGVKATGAAKGWAKPASTTLSSAASCEVGNSALLAISSTRTGARQGNPMPIASKGLERAYWLTAKDMIEHLRSKLIPVFNQFSAK